MKTAVLLITLMTCGFSMKAQSSARSTKDSLTYPSTFELQTSHEHLTWGIALLGLGTAFYYATKDMKTNNDNFTSPIMTGPKTIFIIYALPGIGLTISGIIHASKARKK